MTRRTKFKYDAVVAGYTCLDLTPQFAKIRACTSIGDILRPGTLVEVDNMNISPGGVVPNTGLAMKVFGNDVLLRGMVGNDPLGKLAMDIFEGLGVSEGIITATKSSTGFSVVIAPPGIDRIFLESPGCNHTFASNHIDYEAVAQSRLFHFGYPPLMKRFFEDDGAELVAMFSRVKQLGAVTSLDMSLPDVNADSGTADWRRILERVLPYVDIFTPSIEEALFMLMSEEYSRTSRTMKGSNIIDAIGRQHYHALAEQILGMGAKILLIKAGHRGAYLATGDVTSLNSTARMDLSREQWNNRQIWCEPFPVEPGRVRNACGAGDCAVAAFMTAILNGDNPDTAGKYAMLAGRNNLYNPDSVQQLQDWQAMKQQVEQMQA